MQVPSLRMTNLRCGPTLHHTIRASLRPAQNNRCAGRDFRYRTSRRNQKKTWSRNRAGKGFNAALFDWRLLLALVDNFERRFRIQLPDLHPHPAKPRHHAAEHPQIILRIDGRLNAKGGEQAYHHLRFVQGGTVADHGRRKSGVGAGGNPRIFRRGRFHRKNKRRFSVTIPLFSGAPRCTYGFAGSSAQASDRRASTRPARADRGYSFPSCAAASGSW